MKRSTFNDYIETYILNLEKVNDRAKAKFFLDYLRNYLKTEMGGAALDTPEIFALLDKDFLLGSIEFYIKERHPAKTVAESYRRTVIELCEKICEVYAITNNFLESRSEQANFNDATSKLFANLKQTESRDCLSTDEYETLYEVINDFFRTDDLDEQISKSIRIQNHKPNYFERLVSAIALKLIQQYGLANTTIANLKITDVNMDNKTINANGFTLPINDTLFSHFKLYLNSRALIENKNQADALFIKKDGSPYLDVNGNVDSGQLFLLMDLALGNTSTTKLRYRRISELVSKHINVNLLNKLTGVSEKTIGKISHDYENNLKNDLYNIVNAEATSYTRAPVTHRKGQIQCPFCGHYEDASSENWILIQVSGEKKKYIACRECKGLDGKYRY